MNPLRIGALTPVLALAACSSSAVEGPSYDLRAEARAAAEQIAAHARTHGELPSDLADVDLELADDLEIREYDALEPFMFCLVEVPTGEWVTYSSQGDRIVNRGTGEACLL